MLSFADPQAALDRLIAELDPAALARGHATQRPTDPDAELVRLTAEVAVPLPPPRPRPAPPERVLRLTPVPSRPISLPPRSVAPLLPPPNLPVRSTASEISAAPPEIPSLADFEISLRPRPEAELAVDDFDILETDDSIGPGGVSVEDLIEGDLLASVELNADVSVDTSLGDLDPAPHESTVDQDLKAFFADDSVEGPVGDPRWRARPAESDETTSVAGPRNRRDNSLLTNVKKLFKK